jgi:di/tricarboxylate transporter
MIVLATAGVCSLLISALFAAMLMVIFGILSQNEAHKAMNWFVFVTVGASYGIGTALQNSGASLILAQFFSRAGAALHSNIGVFGSIYFVTGLISNILTNNAAAALMFPIAYKTAVLSDADPILMTYCVVFGASASYMSPFGYQVGLQMPAPDAKKLQCDEVF